MQLGKPAGQITSQPFSSAPHRRFRTIFGILLTARLCACAVPDRVAILRLRVLEGEGAVYAAGARTVRPLSVQVTDETGRPVEGASVSILLPGDGPTGMFNGNMR